MSSVPNPSSSSIERLEAFLRDVAAKAVEIQQHASSCTAELCRALLRAGLESIREAILAELKNRGQQRQAALARDLERVPDDLELYRMARSPDPEVRAQAADWYQLLADQEAERLEIGRLHGALEQCYELSSGALAERPSSPAQRIVDAATTEFLAGIQRAKERRRADLEARRDRLRRLAQAAAEPIAARPTISHVRVCRVPRRRGHRSAARRRVSRSAGSGRAGPGDGEPAPAPEARPGSPFVAEGAP